MVPGSWTKTLFDWWQTPGVSEFVSAIIGAVIGSLSAGLISWLLQRSAFKRDQAIRGNEKNDADRAALLQALSSCAQAASDLYKLKQTVDEAGQRSAGTSIPTVADVSNSWASLLPLATLPEPISIDPKAITVLIDRGSADIAMNVLDVVAIHRSTLKLWECFADSRRRFSEKVTVKIQNGRTYSEFSSGDLERFYPHLKELSDLSDTIFLQTKEHCLATRHSVLRLQEFLNTKMATKLEVKFENDAEGESHLSTI